MCEPAEVFIAKIIVQLKENHSQPVFEIDNCITIFSYQRIDILQSSKMADALANFWKEAERFRSFAPPSNNLFNGWNAVESCI